MQVFVPFKEPIKVAECLDQKRLNKQIIECNQILDAIDGVGKGWFNHPVTKMYSKCSRWLKYYTKCLRYYYLYKHYNRNEFLSDAEMYSEICDHLRPPFLTDEFCDQHKRRLYTKNPEFYKDFAEYGKSEENWYFIGNEIVKYVNGKRI